MRVKTKLGKKIELITSWDDGGLSDLRLVKLLRKYKLPGIFYIPSNNRELLDCDIQEIAKYFEIGGHTVNHQILRALSDDACWSELVDSKEYLENLINKPLNSFCYPRGRYDKKVIEQVKKAGYKEARTTKVLNLFKPENPFEIITSTHVYNRQEYAGQVWFDVSVDLFEKVIDPTSLYDYFYFWGHSWEIDKFDYWRELETLFYLIHENIRYD